MPTPFMTSFIVSKIFITFVRVLLKNKERHSNNNNGGTRFCLFEKVPQKGIEA
jgi:hypothetical protein